MKRLPPLLDFLGSTWLGVGLMALALVYMSIGSALPAIRQYYELTETAWFQTPAFGVILGLLVLSMLVATVRRVAWSRAKAGAWLAHAGALVLCVGAWIYFGHKIEGDVTIPRRAVEIKLPGAEPVRLPVLFANEAEGKSPHEAPIPASQLAANGYAPDAFWTRWRFQIEDIHPAYRPHNPQLLAELKRHNKNALYQVELGITQRFFDLKENQFTRSLLDGFAAFDADRNDNGTAQAQIGKPFFDATLQTRLVLNPVRHFYLRDSAALYVQMAGKPAAEWQVHGLTGALPFYREAFNPAWEKAPAPANPKEATWRIESAEKAREGSTWRQNPLVQFLIIVALLGMSAYFSGRILAEKYRRKVWIGYGVVGLGLLGLLAVRFEQSQQAVLINRGALDLSVPTGSEQPHLRVIGYLPYANWSSGHDQRRNVLAIPPRSERKPLRDVGRTRSFVGVELAYKDWKTVTWLPYMESMNLVPEDQVQAVEVPGLGPVRLAYSRERLPLPEPMALVDFIHEKGLGGEMSTDFISLLAVGDPEKGPMRQGPKIKTQLNEPYSDGTYQYYQAAYDPEFLSSTTLLVTNRHGLGVMLAGIILMVLGMIWAFYVKPMIAMKSGQ